MFVRNGQALGSVHHATAPKSESPPPKKRGRPPKEAAAQPKPAVEERMRAEIAKQKKEKADGVVTAEP